MIKYLARFNTARKIVTIFLIDLSIGQPLSTSPNTCSSMLLRATHGQRLKEGKRQTKSMSENVLDTCEVHR